MVCGVFGVPDEDDELADFVVVVVDALFAGVLAATGTFFSSGAPYPFGHAWSISDRCEMQKVLRQSLHWTELKEVRTVVHRAARQVLLGNTKGFFTGGALEAEDPEEEVVETEEVEEGRVVEILGREGQTVSRWRTSFSSESSCGRKLIDTPQSGQNTATLAVIFLGFLHSCSLYTWCSWQNVP